MAVAAVLGDSLQGNIYFGSITSCRFAGKYTTPCGPLAFVGDEVTATGPVGDHTETHKGTIISGPPQYITGDDGQPVAVLGESQWVAGPFSGVIVGPGCPQVITI